MHCILSNLLIEIFDLAPQNAYLMTVAIEDANDAVSDLWDSLPQYFLLSAREKLNICFDIVKENEELLTRHIFSLDMCLAMKEKHELLNRHLLNRHYRHSPTPLEHTNVNCNC
jgi:hypothetical protein